MRFVVPTAAAVIVASDIDVVARWCDEMCSSSWIVQEAEIKAPRFFPDVHDTYVIYFTSKIDCKMFHNAFRADISIAAEMVPTR